MGTTVLFDGSVFPVPGRSHLWASELARVGQSPHVMLELISCDSHMFMINHNLNAKVFPSLRARSPLPAPTAAPGLFDGIAGAIHNAGNVINSGISQVGGAIQNGASQVGSAIQSGASQVGGAIHSAINSGVNDGKNTLDSVLVPDYLKTQTTNSIRSILADSNGCSSFSGGKATSFVMLDFVEVGEGLKAVDRLNGFL